MTPERSLAPPSADFVDLLATLETTDDVTQRQMALLRYYGARAQSLAQSFLDDILVNRDLRPGDAFKCFHFREVETSRKLGRSRRESGCSHLRSFEMR